MSSLLSRYKKLCDNQKGQFNQTLARKLKGQLRSKFFFFFFLEPSPVAESVRKYQSRKLDDSSILEGAKHTWLPQHLLQTRCQESYGSGLNVGEYFAQFSCEERAKKVLLFFPFRFDVNWSLWSLMLFHCYYRSLHSFWIFEIKSSFIDESQSNISLCCAWTVDYRNLFNLWVKINFDLLQGLNGDEGIQHNDLW